MSEENNNRVLRMGAWKAILFAVVLLVVGELFLAWQYNRLESERLPMIEQKLEQQQQAIELQGAEETLKDFLNARLAGDESKAKRLFTEVAMQQYVEGEFKLLENFTDFEITSPEKIGEDAFRFRVDLVGENELVQQVELVRVRKFNRTYYIDSVQLAG